jgi:NAD(P)-dependent dehydrogenase (short-subunit alcohol dehydrogenase family)
MPKTIVIVGFGPAISTALAEKFGAEGFSVALIARNADRLVEGAQALKAKGITAAGFPADASDPDAIAAAIEKAREALGPISVLHWNATAGLQPKDLLVTPPAEAPRFFDVAIVGLLAAVQAALPDLKAAGDGAVLVTNGGLGEINPRIDGVAVDLQVMGPALASTAKHKLVGLLSQRLKGEGVYVGEVMVAGAVKGTPFARGGPGIESAAIADKFWALHQARDEIRARITIE